jgi:hypothetical protein
VVAVVEGCGVLVGVLVAVRVSVCDGTGTLAGVVVILAVCLRVLLFGVAHDAGVSRHVAECDAAARCHGASHWRRDDGDVVIMGVVAEASMESVCVLRVCL